MNYVTEIKCNYFPCFPYHQTQSTGMANNSWVDRSVSITGALRREFRGEWRFLFLIRDFMSYPTFISFPGILISYYDTYQMIKTAL